MLHVVNTRAWQWVMSKNLVVNGDSLSFYVVLNFQEFQKCCMWSKIARPNFHVLQNKFLPFACLGGSVVVRSRVTRHVRNAYNSLQMRLSVGLERLQEKKLAMSVMSNHQVTNGKLSRFCSVTQVINRRSKPLRDQEVFRPNFYLMRNMTNMMLFPWLKLLMLGILITAWRVELSNKMETASFYYSTLHISEFQCSVGSTSCQP